MNASLLLVEDEVVIAMSEKKEGYTVTHVTTGEDAIRLVAKENQDFDIILMDVDLGRGIDGIQAAQQILQVRDIPIIFLSSHGEPEVVEKAEKITSYGYILKSSSPVVLDVSINMALRLFQEKMEHRRAEEKLKESEERFRSLAEASMGGIGIHGRGVILECNEALCRMTGYSKEELIGMNGLLLIAEESREDVMQKILSGYEKPYEAVGLRRDGTKYPLLIQGRNVYYKGKLVRSTEFRDLSDIKQAEEALKKKIAEEEVLLREAFHRIKNHITNVVSLLSLQANATENPEAKQFLQESIGRVESIRVLYENLLTKGSYQTVSLKAYIEEVIRLVCDIFDEKRRIRLSLDIADVTIAAKKAVFLGIVMNELLTNAYKYAFRGRDSGEIAVSIHEHDGKVSMVVRDNGVGMEERMDASSQGLGIMLVTMLVTEQLGGKYERKEDNGTVWEIEFVLEG
ncbi:PAS domain S-box protein [Thermospira aquatica]|uniref:histidine kinase n=1 Tax=Thermospira aquatica TaxID=2828656 RepID=A0AAX3BEJ1_9SPIR|nr:PAS domain S-box protein [Thermospira aquatica]URA10727.1 PAS domain S-box protein [Thermospira aquatica]